MTKLFAVLINYKKKSENAFKIHSVIVDISEAPTRGQVLKEYLNFAKKKVEEMENESIDVISWNHLGTVSILE